VAFRASLDVQLCKLRNGIKVAHLRTVLPFKDLKMLQGSTKISYFRYIFLPLTNKTSLGTLNRGIVSLLYRAPHKLEHDDLRIFQQPIFMYHVPYSNVYNSLCLQHSDAAALREHFCSSGTYGFLSKTCSLVVSVLDFYICTVT